MAYAALVSVSHTLEEILDSDPYFFPCAKEKVESFQETIASLITFLDNCPPICTQTINDLIKQIRDSACEAEDVFESLVATHFRQKCGSDHNHEKSKMLPQCLEKVMEDIESMEKEVKKIRHEVKEQRILALSSSSRQPALRGCNTKMVALDSDLQMKLMEQLVGGGRSRTDVIPIVGMGGIGKTTLARILYISPMIKETFEIRGWVTISQTYNVEGIALRILKDIGTTLDGKKEAEQRLYQILYGRKCLIVLDDVWSTQTWDDIKRLFPDNNNGSRIILTTRHSKVAAYANSFGSYHEMQLLNNDSSWSLLCQEIFPDKRSPSELVDIGKDIARQCRGLPLVISAIGGHLKTEKLTKEYWKYVSENVSSVLMTTNDPSLEILTLSYNYLPHHLKACFLYFGSFLEDYSIFVSEIVRLWVAEGFVKPSGSYSMEDVAEQYLRDLIERNLLFVYDCDSLGKPKMCGIHDLFRDICIREARKEKFLYILSKDIPVDFTEINSQRRLVLSADIIDQDDESSSCIVSIDGSCSATRSLICDCDETSPSAMKIASGLLRVLNIRMKSTKFPVEVLDLVNLKYLQLGYVSKIPSSISRLRNLQTLIAWPMYIDSIPAEIWEMPQLRHLLISGFHLPDIPDVQGNGVNPYVLGNLQTISYIIDFRCTQEAIRRIPNLKELNIAYNVDAVGLSLHSLNNLVYFGKLESMRCDFNFVPNDDMLVDHPVFPFSLKKLVLVGCRIPWERMRMISTLPNLEVLRLYGAMKGKFWKTNDGEFQQLKFLYVGNSELVEWRTEEDHFPRLRHLVLKVCKQLEAIPYEIGQISTLEIIELVSCSSAAESSAKQMLGEDNDIKLIVSN